MESFIVPSRRENGMKGFRIGVRFLEALGNIATVQETKKKRRTASNHQESFYTHVGWEEGDA
jgi:hypothetical protein